MPVKNAEVSKGKGQKAEFPEAGLIRSTLTLRRLDLPQSVFMTKRSLLRWIALSLGLISENESRRASIEVLDALFYFLFSKKANPSIEQIKKYLEEKRNVKISERLIRYHLDKLVHCGFIARKKRTYCINPAPQGEREDIIASIEYYTKAELEESLKHILIAMEKLIEKYKE